MYLLFDIGGTKTRFAYSPDGKKINPPVVCATSQKISDAKRHWGEQIALATGGKKIKAAAGGVTGTLSKDRSKLLSSPNLRKWEGKNIKKMIEGLAKAPAILENDADLAGLGEAVFGAGKGYKIVAYITVSTGVGGTRIVNGKIDEFSVGFEPGHMVLDTDRLRTISWQLGGSKLKKVYGVDAIQIDDRQVWRTASKILGVSINNANVFWSPDIFVVGGSIGLNKIDFKIVEKYFAKANDIYPKLPKIKKAELGDMSGLWGALKYVI